jgi:hypothetical protein
MIKTPLLLFYNYDVIRDPWEPSFCPGACAMSWLSNCKKPIVEAD